jgi:hypothetical protein
MGIVERAGRSLHEERRAEVIETIGRRSRLQLQIGFHYEGPVCGASRR